jgi:hypothetical protein
LLVAVAVAVVPMVLVEQQQRVGALVVEEAEPLGLLEPQILVAVLVVHLHIMVLERRVVLEWLFFATSLRMRSATQ